MKKFLFRALYTSIALFALLYQNITAATVLCAVAIIVTTGSLVLIRNRMYRMIIIIVYGLLASLYPPLKYGLVIVAYDMDEMWLLILIALNVIGLSVQEAFWLVGLSSVAYYVSHIERQEFKATTQMASLEIHQETLEINRQIIEKQQIEKQQDDLDFTRIGERNRIARDIHDNVGHLLSSAIIQVGALQTINKDDKLVPFYETLKETLDLGMNSIRKSVHDLYEDSTPLEDEVMRIIDMTPSLDVSLEYKIQGTINQLTKNTLLSIIKECLNNTIKHSDGNRVKITLDDSDQNVYCIIHDNGTTNKVKTMSGIGLAGIEKRVQALKGICNIQTDKGYRIYINIPKEAL